MPSSAWAERCSARYCTRKSAPPPIPSQVPPCTPAPHRSRTGDVGHELTLALQWFREILALKIHETACWKRKRRPPLHLFCDARGHPPRVAAVLFGCAHSWHCLRRCSLPIPCRTIHEGTPPVTWYCDLEPPAELLEKWTARRDNQIMGQEILSIALGCNHAC